MFSKIKTEEIKITPRIFRIKFENKTEVKDVERKRERKKAVTNKIEFGSPI